MGGGSHDSLGQKGLTRSASTKKEALMPQPTCQDSHPGVYKVNGVQTIFLATRQELLERISDLSPYTGKEAADGKGFPGQQRFTRLKS